VQSGLTNNPLQPGVGHDLEGLLLLDMCDALLVWIEQPTNAVLIEAAKASIHCYVDMLGGYD
jgi:hypothetical protein